MSNAIHQCQHCRHTMCAKKVPLFSELNEVEIKKIVQLIIRKRYKKGEIALLQGNQLDGLYVINKGKIKIFKYTKEGKEQILYFLSEGDFFGELSLLESEEIGFNVEAMEPVEICLIRKKDFEVILKNNNEITLKILQVISSRLSKLENLVQSLGTKDVEARIAQMLLDLTNKFGKNKDNRIELSIPLTREDMANYIGVTRETISRKLSIMQEEGILKLVGNKKIIIDDLSLLERYL
ncbi:Crp/Fnr family transcriptional regulator [Alkaliphilus crotonatoxidans]